MKFFDNFGRIGHDGKLYENLADPGSMLFGGAGTHNSLGQPRNGGSEGLFGEQAKGIDWFGSPVTAGTDAQPYARLGALIYGAWMGAGALAGGGAGGGAGGAAGGGMGGVGMGAAPMGAGGATGGGSTAAASGGLGSLGGLNWLSALNWGRRGYGAYNMLNNMGGGGQQQSQPQGQPMYRTGAYSMNGSPYSYGSGYGQQPRAWYYG